MFRILFLILTISFCNLSLEAQKLITKTGEIEININTPIYSFVGINEKVASIINLETGEVVISTLIRSFTFDEALLEEQFNNNYVESDKFPSTIFIGKIMDFKNIDLSINGKLNILIEGKLNLHGVTKYIKEKAVIIVSDNTFNAEANFFVSAESYEIKLEEVYMNSIDDNIGIRVNLHYKPYARK